MSNFDKKGVWSGAEVRKPGISQNTMQNGYLLANIGFNEAEKEP